MLTRESVTRDNSTAVLKTARIIAIIIIIAWMIVIFSFSSDNHVESFNMSNRVMEIFNKIVEIFTGKDLRLSITPEHYLMIETCLRKLAHMFIYFVLCITVMLFLFTFKIPMLLRMTISTLFCFIYACIDEFHQSFVAGRGASFTDSLIDTSGAILGMLASLIIYCVIYTLYNKYQKYKINKYNASLKKTADN